MPTQSVEEALRGGAETLSRLHESLHVVRARIAFSRKVMSESRNALARADDRIEQHRRAALRQWRLANERIARVRCAVSDE